MIREAYITPIDIDTVSIVEPLQSPGHIDVKIQVMFILLSTDSCQICKKVFMNVLSEWLRSLDLIVDGGVERQSPADHFNDLTR